MASPEARLATVAGDANLGYNNNARAEELYSAALTKTGADAELLNTRIGIARFQAGNYTSAIEAFERVQSPLRSPVARMWIALSRSRIAAAAPAAPAVPEPAPAS
jgi:Flp pilus assembly protein TadD